MNIFDTQITREQMPSYEIGQNYPTRRWQFMQDTISGALANQAAMQNPQQGVGTQPVGSAGEQ